MASRFSSRIQVIALAAWHSLRTLGKRRAPTNPRRILIAHHLLLGDTLMLTPLLAKLRERHPDAEIVMTAPKAIAPLYEKRPYGVLAIPYDPRDPATLKTLLGLRGFDLAIVPGDNRYSWLARALDARWIVAFSGDRPAWKNWATDRCTPYPDTPATWGDMTAGLIDGPAPAPYHVDMWPDPDCTPLDLPREPYGVLHVGAGNPLRLWAPEKWLELATHLSQRGLTVVWSAGPGEHNLIAEIDREGRYPSYAGKLDLPQLWKLFKHAALVVCPDTGVSHLTKVTGTPSVTLFGQGSDTLFGAGDFWRLNPYRAIIVPDFPCRNQNTLFKRQLAWVRRCARTPAQCVSADCMTAIGILEVAQAADQLLD